MGTNQETRPTITPAADGPYLVAGLATMKGAKGPVGTKPQMALCRCGESKNKPFCDGTHTKIGFSSAKLDGRVEDEREDYVAGDLTVHDNRGLCAHAARCTEGLPGVFRSSEEPFIDPQGASAAEIIAIVEQCPSGALSYSLKGHEHRDRDAEPAVFVAPGGPYVVTGGAQLVGVELGAGASTEHFTLCRCGGSKNKPFCDGAHWTRTFDEHAK